MGTALIAEISRKVMDMGKVSFYNTELSHMDSLRVALKAGFVPGFCELRSEKYDNAWFQKLMPNSDLFAALWMQK